jgi:hypothetical protein
MAKKKAPSKSIKDRLNAGYEKMQLGRMKEKAGKSCKNGCNCER